MPEPRLDDFWRARGEALEDLSRLHGSQHWEPDGVRLSRDAFVALAQVGRRRVGAARVKDEAAATELESVGLVDGAGRLTDDGMTTHAVLSTADRRIRVESAASGVPGTYEAARRQGAVVVWATDSPASWDGRTTLGRDRLASATSGTLLWLPTMQLPTDLAAWLQVGPSWPMDLPPDAIATDLVTARMDDPRAPAPDGAGEFLREVWAQPWFTWTVTTDTEHRLAGIHAGRHGHLRLQDHGSSLVTLGALPSEAFFSILVGMSLL